MPRYSRKKINAFFAQADAATTAAEKGRALEDLTEYLFGSVPGLKLSSRDKKNTYETEEIDVAFWNEQHPKGFKALGFLLLVECKNWSEPVGSAEVSWFITKLRHRALDFGILLAANGITGDAADSRQAHDVVSKALVGGIRVVVITRAEIEAMKTSDDLVTMVKLKLCELTASGTVWP